MSNNTSGDPSKPFNLLPLFATLVLGAFAIFLIAICWPDRQMASRDIGCAKVTSARGQEICSAISASMEWTWMGHGIVSPGWRTTWPGIARVYCNQHVTVADFPVLKSFKAGLPDWRLESGADNLMRIVTNANGQGDEPESSIFNPKNPSYILKNGCR